MVLLVQERGIDLRFLRHLADGHAPETVAGKVIFGGVENAFPHVGRGVRLQRSPPADKHGLIGFSKTVALETHDVDVTINTVCPGYVKTPLVEAQIAALVRNITGQCLVLDGGWTAQ